MGYPKQVDMAGYKDVTVLSNKSLNILEIVQ